MEHKQYREYKLDRKHDKNVTKIARKPYGTLSNKDNIINASILEKQIIVIYNYLILFGCVSLNV